MKRPFRAFLLLSIFCILLTGCSGGATTTTLPTTATGTSSTTGVPSVSFQLTGLVLHPGKFTLTDLQAFPKVTVTTNTHPLGQHTFGGALLYDVLQKAEITTDNSRKNDILRKAVLVTGTDGYAVGVSLGEILPRFAGKQAILAYEEDGKPLPQADGFTRLIVPGDSFAGRYVSNVATVKVESPGPVPVLGTRAASSAFFLVGLVNKSAKYDLTALKALKPTEVTVQGQSQSGQASTTMYSGVLLYDLLQSAGVQLKKSKNDFLRKGIVAVGSDGYSALVVGGEIAPNFGHVQALIAFAENGQPLPASDGFARLVVPGDQAAGRFVSNLVEVQVVELAS